MCGFIAFSGAFEMSALQAGLRAIAHRGPDDAGLWADAPAGVGLGHVRLSIQDLSPLGHQPMAGPDGQVMMAFNGEIFNFRELRADLAARGHTFRGHSDTEVLLHLYLAEGEAMLPRLNGMFAFAIWDARRQALFVARDDMGVKPLYYTQTPQGVLLASEMKALLAFPGVPRQVNPVALRNHLTYLWAPAPQTLLAGVGKLPPGDALWVQGGRITPVTSEMAHHDSPDLDHWLEKQNRYTTAEAVIAYNQSALADTPSLLGNALQRRMWLKKNFYRVSGRYLALFFYHWLVQGAWRAGKAGFVWARLRVVVMQLIEYKRLEMELTGRLPVKRHYGPGQPDPRVRQY